MSVDFANIVCPTLTLASTDTTISYSFPPAGGQVDKYEVELWDSSGKTRLDYDTHLPSLVFPNPITGTFESLTVGATYKVRIVAYIGTYTTYCAFSSKTTVSQGAVAWTYANNVGTGGRMRIAGGGVDTTTSGSGNFVAPVGTVITVTVYSTVPGEAVIDISGSYVISSTQTHINIEDFTVASGGNYVVAGQSNV